MNTPILFKIAIRNLARNRIHTIIHVAGLSVSLMVCILIALFVRDEYRFDGHFDDGEHVYRIAGNYGSDNDKAANTTFLLQPIIANELPGVNAMCRIGFSAQLLIVEQKEFMEYGVVYADSSFFRVFQVPFVRGDRSTALDRPGNIVLDEATALRYFGTNDVLGRAIIIREKSFVISGVMETWPSTSHFYAQIILPMSGIVDWLPDWVKDNRTGRNMYTYFRADPFDRAKLEASISQVVATHWTDDVPRYFIQPLQTIHLHSHLQGEIETNGDAATVNVFVLAALIILTLACVNYINLTTAGSFQRSKEFGVKKILGSSTWSQLGQFLTESLIVVSFSTVIAGFGTALAMPVFTQLSGKSLEFNPFVDGPVALGLFVAALIISLLAGILPAILLIRAKPISLLSKRLEYNNGSQYLRNGLIVFQFAISAALIASTLIVVDQMNYLRTKDLGVYPERLVIVPLQTTEISSRFDILKTELLRHADVVSVTGSNNKVTQPVTTSRPYVLDWKKEDVGIPSVTVSYDFFETMGARMVAGRSFSRDVKSDLKEAYIINESAAKFLSMREPVGKRLFGFTFTGSKWFEKNGTIVGVVKDFHFASLHTAIVPTVFTLASETTESLDWMEIRITGDTEKALGNVATTWGKIAPERSFNFEFMEDNLKEHYKAERIFQKLFSLFSALSIFIGGLGLFGLTAFMTVRRTKEIGIRKVLGGSVPQIIRLLSGNFLVMVLLSNLIAWPIAYYFMKNWLMTFAYQTTISFWIFVVTGAAAVLIACLAIFYPAWRVAQANPVNALHCE